MALKKKTNKAPVAGDKITQLYHVKLNIKKTQTKDIGVFFGFLHSFVEPFWHLNNWCLVLWSRVLTITESHKVIHLEKYNVAKIDFEKEQHCEIMKHVYILICTNNSFVLVLNTQNYFPMIKDVNNY